MNVIFEKEDDKESVAKLCKAIRDNAEQCIELLKTDDDEIILESIRSINFYTYALKRLVLALMEEFKD